MAETLYLRKRGCDFFMNDPELPENKEIGNYRVYAEFEDEDGSLIQGDFMLRRIWTHPRKPPTHYCLTYDLQRNCCVYHFPFSTENIPYTFAGILESVNRVSPVKYDKCEFTTREGISPERSVE